MEQHPSRLFIQVAVHETGSLDSQREVVLHGPSDDVREQTGVVG